MKKDFFKNRKNLVTLIIIVIAVLAVLLVAIFTKREYKQRFALNPIYDIHPEQVRELYMNMVSVSCVGDLHLDVELGAKAIDVKDMNMVNLLNYAFSNLDKSDKLSDNMEESIVKTVFSDLFYGKLDLTNIINNYQYGDYIYTLTDGVITREEKECISDINMYLNCMGIRIMDNFCQWMLTWGIQRMVSCMTLLIKN